MSLSEWIILRTGVQTWYNYFIPSTFCAKVVIGGIWMSIVSEYLGKIF